jgi:protease I
MPDAPLGIAVLLEDGFEDDELRTLIDTFDAAGFQLTLLAPFAQRTYSGRHGQLTLTSDLAAHKTRADRFAAVVIPGGYAPDKLRMRHAVLDLIRDGVADGVTIGAIGHGPQVLISAAVVAGRTMTSWPSIAIDLKNAGALYVDRPVVDDRGIVTARKTDDVGVFVNAILRRIENSR